MVSNGLARNTVGERLLKFPTPHKNPLIVGGENLISRQRVTDRIIVYDCTAESGNILAFAVLRTGHDQYQTQTINQII